MKIQIEPITAGLRRIANFVELFQGGYALGSEEGCKVRVQYFENADLIAEERIDIPADLVATWTDDQPIIDYVFIKLNLVAVCNEQGIY